MPNEENPDCGHTANNQLFALRADNERAKEIERLRSMTVEEKFEQLERLYLEGQKIELTDEEEATRKAEKEEIRERWNRLRLAYSLRE
jgi:hypothetical protein